MGAGNLEHALRPVHLQGGSKAGDDESGEMATVDPYAEGGGQNLPAGDGCFGGAAAEYGLFRYSGLCDTLAQACKEWNSEEPKEG